ncbi:cytochrome P450 [Didymella exigua CBS 183.55]|uniref:Cytochrome P450 n=1 Tax=Didymella exigua CBS 183.55 TaxID=1150837 RepID=A0A6A5RGJ2_9PLEO|nr:cytochrome P450 [Didymella exigua CBS 183.55]KAF1925616.1 cytochrome P450 [Didymella exigua CBS 183.55]
MDQKSPGILPSLLLHNSLVFNSITLILSLLSAYFAAQYVYFLTLHPLVEFPGPRLCSISRIPYWLAAIQGRDVQWMYQLHIKYGPVVRFGPTDLSYATAQAWRDIHGHSKGRPENHKAPEFSAQPINGVPSMLNATFEDHARVRRLFSPAFSDRALKKQEPLFKAYVDILLTKLVQIADSQQPAELTQLFNFATFDTMAKLCFGHSLSLLEKNELSPWVRSIFESLKMLPFASIIAYYPLLDSMFKRYEPRWVTEQRKTHCQYSANRVDQRLQEGSDQPDIWNLIILAQDSKNALSTEEMHSNAELFMMAGSETTATLLSGLTYYLLQNTKQCTRLNNELRNRFQSPKDMTFDSLAQCKYLNACLKEGLRIYPPVPIGSPRVIPAGGQQILGKWIPEETRVSVHHYSTYRSQANFRDSDQFIPERWMPRENAIYANDVHDALQPFGWGHRNCLGQNMALHEIRLILASVMLCFDLELCKESQGWLEQKSFALWMKNPLLCKIKARHTGEVLS